MNAAQTEAVANADAHLNNAALPTYTELLDTLYRALPFIEDAKDDLAYKPGVVAKVEREIRALIDKAAGSQA